MDNENNFCPSCGNKLSGNEDICPFCGYKIVENAISQDENLPPSGIFRPLKSSPVNKENNVPVEEKPRENNDKPEITDELKTEPIPLTPPVIPEVQQNEQLSAQSDELPKKKSKIVLWLVIIAAALVIVSFVVIALIHSLGVAKIGFMERIFPSSQPEVVVTALEKNYYFCYSATSIDNKMTVILSTVYNQSTSGNSITTATDQFTKYISIRYPRDYRKFKPVVCRQFNNYEDAAKLRSEILSNYLKKKYKVRFAEIN